VTIGQLVASIAEVGKRLQRQNPDLTLDEFHAINVLIDVDGKERDLQSVELDPATATTWDFLKLKA